MEPINYMASVAKDVSFSNAQQPAQLIDLIAKSGAAVLVLIAITTISVYKPWGKIKQNELPGKIRTWRFYLLTGLALLLILFFTNASLWRWNGQALIKL
jgi:hypothetical protein